MQLSYPSELPISSQRDAIVSAIENNQVLVIAGDTGSGKTTQIPKMCLEAGRGEKGMIGCTQPRRIAAVSVAERVADELRDNRLVGYKIRFRDHTTDDTLIKFMTDGVLLAEKRRDRNLNRYDTIIIDEAHERSLNIDFLLGYLKTLISRRPDLKLIITSATIDTEKFSACFSHAPIINVSGRTFPITFDHLAHEESDYTDAEVYVDQAVREAIDLTEHHPAGDILIFMPTERDILDCTDMLQKLSGKALVLPLFGRLQASDQRKIFRPSHKRKIVVATNVAETSITIPGIRYVIDSGLARIARYNPRARTTSLKVTAVSRASCDQRAGRCGRTGPGRCIRLYSEDDYLSRPEYTQPEIQRSNLAEVILHMVSLDLGDPRKFPFIDPPSNTSINDGYKVLRELGALGANNELTSKGKIMARLPLDPCFSRILIEAAELGAIKEIKIITAGLSIQDPRIRPAEKEEKADEKHRLFIDKKSDFLTLLSIWDSYHATARQTGSRSKLRKFCSSHFLSWQRMREWLDIHEQITGLTKYNKKFRDNRNPASYADIHKSLLSGFLGNIGQKKEKNVYRIRGNREVMIFPGSALFNRTLQWTMSASFMETSRLYAINVAAIDVNWLEEIGGELCRKSWSEPRWEKKTGQVIALEKVTLFGLVIVAGRKVNFAQVNRHAAKEAREIFIRQALIAGELGGHYPFLKQNMALLRHYEEMEDRIRRRNIIYDDMTLFTFYDKRLGDVFDRRSLNRSIKQNNGDHFLCMKEEDICREVPEDRELYLFPQQLNVRSYALKLQYCFKPGNDDDGVTADIPLARAPEIDPVVFEWLVPGLLREKVHALLKFLPKKLRRRLIPLPETVEIILDGIEFYKDSLYTALEKFLFKHFQIKILRTDWHPEKLPLHLKMRFRLMGNKGEILLVSRSFNDLLEFRRDKKIEQTDTSQAFQLPKSVQLTTWSFDYPPEPLRSHSANDVRHETWYPTLVVDSSSRCVQLKYIEENEKSIELNRSGLRFLFSLQFKAEVKALSKECKTAIASHSASWLSLGLSASAAGIQESLTAFILNDLFHIAKGTLPSGGEFEETVARVREKGMIRCSKSLLDYIHKLLILRREIHSTITRNPRNDTRFEEYAKLLRGLLPPDFLTKKELNDLKGTDRYLKALAIRIERARHSPAKDARKAEQVRQAAGRLDILPKKGHHRSMACQQCLDEYRKMIEEFRVSVFAPELGTSIQVSEKRLKIKWQEVENVCHRIE